MSKAFDSIDRKVLLTDMQEIINEIELHILHIRLNVKLTVRCGEEYNIKFETDTRGQQGDSISANEFTFYLVKSTIKILKRDLTTCHNLKPPSYLCYS